MDIYQHDASFRKKGYGNIAGVDEAGRGPLAGPVVAAAVIFPEKIRIDGLRDSKKVSQKAMKGLFWDVLTSAKDIGVGIIGHEEIDRINILEATRLAMMSALNDLSLRPDLVIIDAVSIPSVPFRQLSLIRGESKSASVAAASIIAKYVRDAVMLHYNDLYPEYNFKRHKGYCTAEHMNMLSRYGPCPIHRKTFKRVMSPELPL